MSYFQKSFIHTLAVLGYLRKLRRSLGLVLVPLFEYIFYGNILYLSLYQMTVWVYQSFSMRPNFHLTIQNFFFFFFFFQFLFSQLMMS